MLVYVVKRGLLRNKGNVGVFPGLGWSNLLVREIESPSSALQLRCKTLSKPLFQTYFFVLSVYHQRIDHSNGKHWILCPSNPSDHPRNSSSPILIRSPQYV